LSRNLLAQPLPWYSGYTSNLDISIPFRCGFSVIL
jgi:hypothetical protein